MTTANIKYKEGDIVKFPYNGYKITNGVIAGEPYTQKGERLWPINFIYMEEGKYLQAVSAYIFEKDITR